MELVATIYLDSEDFKRELDKITEDGFWLCRPSSLSVGRNPSQFPLMVLASPWLLFRSVPEFLVAPDQTQPDLPWSMTPCQSNLVARSSPWCCNNQSTLQLLCRAPTRQRLRWEGSSLCGNLYLYNALSRHNVRNRATQCDPPVFLYIEAVMPEQDFYL